MKENIDPLIEFEITFEDKDGVEHSRIFTLDEDVIDYIRFLEAENLALEDEYDFYKAFYQTHFAMMTNMN